MFVPIEALMSNLEKHKGYIIDLCPSGDETDIVLLFVKEENLKKYLANRNPSRATPLLHTNIVKLTKLKEPNQIAEIYKIKLGNPRL